jgi:DNA-binding NarL/FixJ family response regulator
MTTLSQIRVVIADDQTAVRQGLELLLGLLDEVRIVGSAAGGDEAVRLVTEYDADVALIDLHLAGSPLARIRAEHPRTQVVMLTTQDAADPAADAEVAASLRAGAFGHLPKDAGRRRIADAIRAAAIRASDGDRSGPREPKRSGPLTAREAEVLGLIAAGMSNREIAAHLFVSEATVKSHINRLFAKTGAHDRAQAVQYARSRGIVAAR